MTSWLEYEAMNKRRSQIKYYVNNLTLTHYCQIHLSNSPSLPSPYYLPSLPLYFLLFLSTPFSLLSAFSSSYLFLLSTPYFLSFLVPAPPFTILYFLECSSLYSLPRFLPCTHSSLYHTIFPCIFFSLLHTSFFLHPTSFSPLYPLLSSSYFLFFLLLSLSL